MSLIEAVRKDVGLWRGNQESLSQALFSKPRTMSHKLSGFKGMALSMEEAVELMLLTGGRDTMHAIARELGGVFIPLPEGSTEFENADICAEMERIYMAMGDLVRETRASIDNDGKIDGGEERLIHDLRQKAVTCLASYVFRVMAVYGDNSTQHYQEQHHARTHAE
jgi:hypothetical protein